MPSLRPELPPRQETGNSEYFSIAETPMASPERTDGIKGTVPNKVPLDSSNAKHAKPVDLDAPLTSYADLSRHGTGTFANGAATSVSLGLGKNQVSRVHAPMDQRIHPADGSIAPDTLHARHETAEGQLSPDAKTKILKEESEATSALVLILAHILTLHIAKNSKHMSKILNNEAKSQTLVLKTSIKDLDHLQSIQKQMAKVFFGIMHPYRNILKSI